MKEPKSAPKAEAKDMTPVILTADTLISLVERVGKLERDNADLRVLVTKNHAENADNLQKSLDSVYSQCIPDLMEDGRLRFKAYDNNANPVLGLVQAEITTEES